MAKDVAGHICNYIRDCFRALCWIKVLNLFCERLSAHIVEWTTSIVFARIKSIGDSCNFFSNCLFEFFCDFDVGNLDLFIGGGR